MADKKSDLKVGEFIRVGRKVSWRQTVAGTLVTGKGTVTAQASLDAKSLHICVTESSNALLVAVCGCLVVSDYTLL
jgi:hypothetical protein